MSCDNDKRTYISAPLKPGFAQLREIPKIASDWTGLQNFLRSVKDALEGTAPNNPVIPFQIEDFVAATTTTGVRLTWKHDKNSAFYVIHRNNINNFDQSRIVCAMYADHGRPSFFDVGGQDEVGAKRFYWIRGYGPTGAAGPLSAPLVSTDPGIFAEAEMIGPITDTLITLVDETTKAVQDLEVGDELWPIDPSDPLVITEKPTPEVRPCIEFETMTGKIFTITETQLVHEYDGGMIPAIALVVGNEIRTIDGNEVITRRRKVGDQTVWRVRLNQKMWYTAERVWIWGLGTGRANDIGAPGFTGPSVFQMVTRGCQSSASHATSFKGSLLRFDGDWFTSPDTTFAYELDANNSNMSTAYDIVIEDTSGNPACTITIPANTTGTFTGTFTPLSGERTYRILLPQTASGNQVGVSRLDLVANCVEELTPVFQVCFDGQPRAGNQDDLVSGDSRFVNGGDTGYLEESELPLFFKKTNGYFEVDHWSLDTVMGHTGLLGGPHWYVRLARADGAAVAETDGTTGTPALYSVDFNHDAANFTSGDEFTIFTRAQSGGAMNTIYLKSYLLVFYSNFRKGEIFYNTGRTLHLPSQPSQVSGIVVDATLKETVAGTKNWQLRETPTFGGSYTPVTGGDLNPSGATKTRYRSSPIAAPTDPFLISDVDAGSGTITAQSSWLVFSALGAGAPGPYYYRMQRDFEESESSTELGFRVAQIGVNAETLRAKLFADGKFNAVKFGILSGNQGIDFDGDPRTLSRLRVDKGLVTLTEEESSSSASSSSAMSSSSGGGQTFTPTIGIAYDADKISISSITLGSNSTLVGWYYLTKSTTNYNPIWGISSTDEMYYGSGGGGARNNKFEINKSNSIIYTSTTSVQKNGWHLLIIVDDGVALKAYYDNTDMVNTVSSYTSLNGFQITRFNQGLNSNNYGGYMTQLAIFNRALSTGDMDIIWNNGAGVYGDPANSPFDTGLTALWRLDEGIGVIANDASGNAHTGNLNDLSLWRPAQNLIVAP